MADNVDETPHMNDDEFAGCGPGDRIGRGKSALPAMRRGVTRDDTGRVRCG